MGPPCTALSTVLSLGTEPAAGPWLWQDAFPGGHPACFSHCTLLPIEGGPCFTPGVPPFSPSRGQ